MLDPIIKTVEVPCNQQKAFETFIEQIDRWWPKDRNSVSAMSGEVARSVSVEPKLHGRVIEIAHDGETILWGTVAHYSPFDRVSLNWHINLPAEKASLVDVRFVALSDERTRVELTHSHWEVFDEKAEDMRQGYESGWIGVFEQAFVDACR